MSKEQTPITAEVIEILERDYGWKNLDQQQKKQHKLFSLILQDTISVCNDLMQSKVLEALEREFSEVVIFDSGELTKGTDYFKTEVKQRWEEQ